MSDHPWPKRLYALDVSRGFASLAVVVWHWQHFAFDGSVLPADFDRSVQPFYPVLKMFFEDGLAAVEYFFLLSGFIFFWLYRTPVESRRMGFRDFWAQRISRLYPLHVVTLVVVACLQAVYHSRVGRYFVYECNDAYHFVLQLFFASNWGLEKGWSFNGPMWSVSLEVLLYVAFFAVAFLHRATWGTCLTLSMIFLALRPLTDHPFFQAASLYFFGGFVYFATLFISTRFRRARLPVITLAAVTWLVTLTRFYVVDLSAIVERLVPAGYTIVTLYPDFVLFPLTVSALALLEIDRGHLMKRISWIGDITYSAYLLHFPTNLTFALAASLGVIGTNFYLNPLSLVVYFAILIPMSWVTYKWFERPAQDFLRKTYKRRLAPAATAQS